MSERKLTRAQRRRLREKKLPSARARAQGLLPGAKVQLEEMTSDQRELLVFLNGCAEQGNMAASTKEVAEGCGWEMRHAIDVLRQLRALGMISHNADGPGAEPEPKLLEALQRFGLSDATREELDALVLIEQGAARLPALERAGFLIGCGLQELREQGHSVASIRAVVLEYLEAGEDEFAQEGAKNEAPN